MPSFVNENKTEQCLFNKIDVAPVVIRLGYAEIATKASMNVLGGVIFGLSKYHLLL
jgi:hypothetical protein